MVLSACPHENESYKKAYYFCGATCQNPDKNECGKNPFTEGCLCDLGYLRDETNGGCISEENCKKNFVEK